MCEEDEASLGILRADIGGEGLKEVATNPTVNAVVQIDLGVVPP
jgi:hypothetical protein